MPRCTLGLWLLVPLALACQATSSADVVTHGALPGDVEGWAVQLDLSTLEDLPPSCFRRDALVIMPRDPTPETTRWAWVPGAPDELYVGRMSFRLGDAGAVVLPSMMRSSDGVYRAVHVRSRLGEAQEIARTESTLVLRSEGDRLHGTLHLEAAEGCRDSACSEAELRCEVSIGLQGRRFGSELLAQLD